AEVVFHVAGLIKALHAREYVQANAVGTRNLARACADAQPRPRRLVVVSSQAAAGPAMPERPAREADAPHPVSAYRHSKPAAGPALRLAEIVALIGDAFGRRASSIPIPDVALVGAGLAADLLAALTGRPRPFGRRKALEMLHAGWVCSPDRAADELAFRAAT